jgi:hypothetical protein
VQAPRGKAGPDAIKRRIEEAGLRGAGRSARDEALVFSETEVAAFLARQLHDAGLQLSPVNVRLEATQVTAQGRLPLGALLQGPPVVWLSSVVSRQRLGSPVWVTLTGTIAVEAPPGARRARYAEVTLIHSEIGRVSLPGWVVTLMVGPRGASLLRWRVPPVVDRVEVGDGKLTIRTR